MKKKILKSITSLILIMLIQSCQNEGNEILDINNNETSIQKKIKNTSFDNSTSQTVPCYISITKCSKRTDINLNEYELNDCISSQLTGDQKKPDCRVIVLGKPTNYNGPKKDYYNSAIPIDEPMDIDIECSNLIKVKVKPSSIINNHTLPEYVYLYEAHIGWISNTNNYLNYTLDYRISGYKTFEIIARIDDNGSPDINTCTVKSTNSYIHPDDLIISSAEELY